MGGSILTSTQSLSSSPPIGSTHASTSAGSTPTKTGRWRRSGLSRTWFRRTSCTSSAGPWMLSKYMGDDAEATNLHYAAPLLTAKKHKKFVKKHEIAMVGYFKRENDLHHKIFCESIWSLHQAIDRDDIGAN